MTLSDIEAAAPVPGSAHCSVIRVRAIPPAAATTSTEGASPTGGAGSVAATRARHWARSSAAVCAGVQVAVAAHAGTAGAGVPAGSA
jgi:hypothetical protein